ncbi:MAG: hypothetical protein JHC93_08575, partial [Parachlamydiales bacterium]|nr:hypothetical protein [Parachlamydiales bacterium]
LKKSQSPINIKPSLELISLDSTSTSISKSKTSDLTIPATPSKEAKVKSKDIGTNDRIESLVSPTEISELIDETVENDDANKIIASLKLTNTLVILEDKKLLKQSTEYIDTLETKIKNKPINFFIFDDFILIIINKKFDGKKAAFLMKLEPVDPQFLIDKFSKSKKFTLNRIESAFTIKADYIDRYRELQYYQFLKKSDTVFTPKSFETVSKISTFFETRIKEINTLSYKQLFEGLNLPKDW